RMIALPEMAAAEFWYASGLTGFLDVLEAPRLAARRGGGREPRRCSPSSLQHYPAHVAGMSRAEERLLNPSLRVISETLNLALVRRHLSIQGMGKLNSAAGLLRGISDREGTLLHGALARLKEHRFGQLTVIASDGRVVDVEVSEKIDPDLLRSLSM